MIGLLIDACLLIILLNMLAGETVSLGVALCIAFGFGVLEVVLDIGLTVAFGEYGFLLGIIPIGAAIGATVSFLFHVEIKRSMVISAAYIGLKVAVGLLLLVIFKK